MKKNDKFLMIEAYRILFTIIICLHHVRVFSPVLIPVLRHGYMCVEWFFLLSGFLLYRSYKREENHELFAFIVRRLRRLYPEYLFAAIVAILLLGVVPGRFNLSQAVCELLMLQNTGIFNMGGYNFPCWYIAVLMVSSVLIYGCWTINEQIYLKIIAPLSIIMTYTFLAQMDTGFETWKNIGPLSIPLARGFAGISLGVLISVFSDYYISNKTDQRKSNQKIEMFFMVLEAISLFFIVIGIITDYSTETLTTLAFASLLFSVSILDTNNYNSSIWRIVKSISPYCYTAFLCHGVIVKAFAHFDNKFSDILLINSYIVVLIVYTIFTKYAVRSIKNMYLAKQKNDTDNNNILL